jgi:hypothetical protein
MMYHDTVLDCFTGSPAHTQPPAAQPTPPSRLSRASGLSVSRRALLGRTATAMLSGALLAVAGWQSFSPAARAQTINGLDLADPGPFPDRVLGSPAAPVTIIEYASMTCIHCAMFAIETFPELKARFIDTGANSRSTGLPSSPRC